MGKKKTTAAIWTVFLRGSMLSLGIYFAGILLLALLLVKGAIPESGAFPVPAVLCFLSAMSGGLLTARQSPWGTLPSALLNTLVFAGILIAAGAICWQGITWYGHGSILLLCALAGGVVAGILGGRRSHRRKRK